MKSGMKIFRILSTEFLKSGSAGYPDVVTGAEDIWSKCQDLVPLSLTVTISYPHYPTACTIGSQRRCVNVTFVMQLPQDM
jgi:hypothetical protein